MDLATLIPAQQFRYYYSCLSKKEAAVYNSLLVGLLKYSKKITCHGCTVFQVQKIYELLKLDVPELFFVKGIRIRYIIDTALYCTVIPEYRFSICQSYDTLLGMSRVCKEFVDRYRHSSDIQKEKAIHDYLASTVKYKDIGAPYSHEAPGAILFQIGVCEGIAKGFKYLSDQLGLQAIVVPGSSKEQENVGGHAWNIVKIEDYFYHIDTTFDATISTSCIRYDYFNLSDEDIKLSHYWNGNLPICPRTAGIYEKRGCCFKHKRDLVAYIKRTSVTEKIIVFKLPKFFCEDEMIVNSINKLLQCSIQWNLSNYQQYTLTYNLKQMVFQIDLF